MSIWKMSGFWNCRTVRTIPNEDRLAGRQPHRSGAGEDLQRLDASTNLSRPIAELGIYPAVCTAAGIPVFYLPISPTQSINFRRNSSLDGK